MVHVKMSSLHLTTKQPTELLIYSDYCVIFEWDEKKVAD